MSIANKTQVGGTHYQTAHYQLWDMCAELFGAGYFKGNIVRYIVRWRKKDGAEDLRKARHYTEKLLELAESGMIELATESAPFSILQFCAGQKNMDGRDGTLIGLVCLAEDEDDLYNVLKTLDEMIDGAKNEEAAM